MGSAMASAPIAKQALPGYSYVFRCLDSYSPTAGSMQIPASVR